MAEPTAETGAPPKIEITDKKAKELNLVVGTCGKCRARILFGKTPTGAEVPLQARALQVYVVEKNDEGVRTGRVAYRAAFETHFADCPHAAHFRTDKKS